jgi:hypothetical protein
MERRQLEDEMEMLQAAFPDEVIMCDLDDDNNTVHCNDKVNTARAAASNPKEKKAGTVISMRMSRTIQLLLGEQHPQREWCSSGGVNLIGGDHNNISSSSSSWHATITMKVSCNNNNSDGQAQTPTQSQSQSPLQLEIISYRSGSYSPSSSSSSSQGCVIPKHILDQTVSAVRDMAQEMMENLDEEFEGQSPSMNCCMAATTTWSDLVEAEQLLRQTQHLSLQQERQKMVAHQQLEEGSDIHWITSADTIVDRKSVFQAHICQVKCE